MTTNLTQAVQSKYAAVAESALSNDHAGVRAIAQAFGYSAEELASIPSDANMGLSCGNPTATAHLKSGETVVDLGSGGGLDVFLAARKVGPAGRAIGIDMTSAMIERARTAAREGGFANVEFHLAAIDKLPLADNSVDVVISNCVINLVTDKPAVLREIARILKPGGRVAISDIALKQSLPDALRDDVMAYVGCIAGAVLIDEYRQQLVAAGLTEVHMLDTGRDLNAYAKLENQSGCCSPAMADSAPPPPPQPQSRPLAPAAACCTPEASPAKSACCSTSLPVTQSPCCTPEPAAGKSDLHAHLKDLLARYDVNDYAASVQIYALKP